MTTQLIIHNFHNVTIRQRSDGYLNAFSLKGSIPLFKIIEVKSGCYGGSWIHPKAAINLAQWCSPEFAVMVTEWVFKLLKTGTVSLNPDQSNQKIGLLVQSKAEELDQQKIIGNAKRIALNNFIKEHYDYDVLELFDITFQPSEIQQALLNPTKIAERVSLKSSIAVNKELIALGLQTKHYDKKNVYYELTKKGLEYGQYQDTGIRKIYKTIRMLNGMKKY